MALKSSSRTGNFKASTNVVGCALVVESHSFSSGPNANMVATDQLSCAESECSLQPGCEGCDPDNTAGDGESIL